MAANYIPRYPMLRLHRLVPSNSWQGYAWATMMVAASTLVLLILNRALLLSHDVDLLYLPLVLICAGRFGLGAATYTAITSVICWDFFFVKPLYSFNIGSPHDILVTTIFVMVSTITGTLADRERRRTREAATLEERNRLARDIHDTLSQGLTGIVIQLQAAQRVEKTDYEKGRSAVQQARKLAEQCLDEARRSVTALRPEALDRMPLPQALSELADLMSFELPVQMHVAVKGRIRELPSAIEIELLRIGQEAMTNALRHSGANNVTVTLTYVHRSVRLIIEDNGKGFGSDGSLLTRVGFGIPGMRERANQINAMFDVTSAPDGGTVVRVDVPICR